MNTAATLLVENLGRTTLALALAGIVAIAVLRLARSQWPTAHRLAWVLVLLVGWTFVRLPVAVSWYEPEPVAPAVVEPAPADVIVGNVTAADVTAADVISAEQPVIDLAPSAPSSAAPFVVESSIPPRTPAASPAVPMQPAIVPAVSEPPPAKRWHETIDWPTVVVAAWILGMSLCASAWLVGYLRFVRLLGDRQPADDASSEAWRELLAAAGVRQAIPLSISHQFGPMLCCLPRGYELIVPAELWSELDRAGQRAILRHELAHYQRGDVWKSLAARVLALPHWFNPIAWLAVRRFEEAAEWACDRAAIADQPATEYAKLLVHLGQTPHALGYGSSAHGRTLAARVRRVLAGEEQKDSTLKKVSLLLAGLAIAGLSVVQLHLVAQQPAASEAADSEKSVQPPSQESPKEAKPQPEDSPASAEPVAPEQQTLEALQKRMLLEATRAYSAHQAAFDAQTVEMPTIYEWSLRWMTAAEALAKNKAERVAAARGHVERMSNLQKRTDLLYQTGTKGGEAALATAANFYLSEAEKHLAEVEAQATPEKTAPVGNLNSTSREAALQMVEQCKQVYEFNKSQSIQNVPMETQVTWSLRWLRAAELAARNQSERVAAARDHVQRITELKDATEQLFKIGTRGGGASDVAAATYYLADAEQHLAEVENQTALKISAPPAQAPARELETVDLEIKLTELRGELEQTAIRIKTAESRLAGYRRILAGQPNALSSSEVTNAQGEVERLKIQHATLEQQIKLHERKLALVKRQPQPTEPQQPTSEKLLPFQDVPEGRPTLLYAGKDFHQWLKTLREDLDPASRAEAISALAAFANHGHGREAAEAIVEVFKGYKLVPIDSSAQGVMRTKAMYAFNRANDGSVATIPVDDAMAVVLKALASDNANQRLFAVVVVQNLAEKSIVLPLLVERLKDSDREVCRQAAMYLLRKAPETPGLGDVMRQWLSPDEDQQQSQMALLALASAPKAMQQEMAPAAVKLLEREIGGMGRLSNYPGNASTFLHNLGPDAIPALEEGLKSENKTVRERSQQLLDQLRTQVKYDEVKTEPPAK